MCSVFGSHSVLLGVMALVLLFLILRLLFFVQKRLDSFTREINSRMKLYLVLKVLTNFWILRAFMENIQQ